MKKQIGFLLLSVLIVGNGYAGERYYVQKVKDGDTIIVSKLGNNRAEMLEVRLSDIDAPETTKGKRRPGQPYSRMATNALAAEVLNKEVELRCYGLDRNQRSICHVYAEGEDVGLKLVEAGLAWAATYNMKFVRNLKTVPAEQLAKSARRGLWADTSEPIAPWIWRRECWGEGRC
ncbi:thermonuclease family protein [Comamonas jiangduensis]|uniref:thermonuclease family protein n=1 Tax=Comamonas jiangduensis TaxID=1194168 RepID=UPI003BF7BED6